MPINELVFLSNNLLSPHWQKELKIPLRFISFAITEGRMYKHYRNKSTFVVPNDALHPWGNNVVYGALFLLSDFPFYIRLLDAYHMCSLSTLRANHPSDTHHRITTDARPITFNNLNQLSRLLYVEKEALPVNVYMGNPNHPKLNKRLKQQRYRVKSGVEKTSFISLYKEVAHGT